MKETYESNRSTNGLIPFAFRVEQVAPDCVEVALDGTMTQLSMEQYHVLEAMFRGMRARMEGRDDA